MKMKMVPAAVSVGEELPGVFTAAAEL